MNAMLSEKDNKLIRYKEYETIYLGNMSDSILKDNGFADLGIAMQDMYSELLKNHLEAKIQEEHGAELHANVTKLKQQMNLRGSNQLPPSRGS